MAEYHSSQKIIDMPTLQRRLAVWRLKELDTVFTNGVFDILHLGHIDYLERARALGELLIVGLNTDASVRRLKPGRPINSQEARSRVLAALEFVDAIVLFDDDTPAQLIETIRPKVLVKGADYTVEQIAGAAFVQSYGGRVEPLALIPGYSTTNLIERLKNN